MFDSAEASPIEVSGYSDYIREAFITPIRSVSVVDDEYPTLDSLLRRQVEFVDNGKAFDEGALNEMDKEDLLKLVPIVAFCRDPARNWMLDVYDGSPMEDSEGQLRFAQRLTHSDLLVLDYHLEGEHEGPGTRALGIMKQLAIVDHFNLVVVHTKGYQNEPGNLTPVLIDIVSALQKKPDFNTIPPKLFERSIESPLDEWGDDMAGIKDQLQTSLNELDVLAMERDYGLSDKKSCLSSKYAANFRALYNKKPADIEINEDLVFWWVLSQKLEVMSDRFSETGESRVDWDKNGDVNWIRTERIFLTIVGKDVVAEELPERLLSALIQWDPHPHRLLMAKLRHEVDEKGISIASDIVAKHYIQAYWLESLLSANEEELPTKAWGVIEKHWEELASSTKEDLSCFTKKMITCLKDTFGEQGVKDKFIKEKISGDRDNVLAYANIFNCSKSVVGHHLTTGHVVKIIVGETSQYWLCMSPACDLVPGQKDYKLGSHLPVKLVRLYDARTVFEVAEDKLGLKRALEVANSNELLFLNIEGVVCAFSFTYRYGKGNPKWEQFYANQNGLFRENNLLSLKRVGSDSDDALEITTCDAEVVAQLRYEYALNLLQKLGVSLTRIGLDFAQLDEEKGQTIALPR